MAAPGRKKYSIKEESYKIALPFTSENVNLPNNRAMAERRIKGLKRRLDKDPALHKRYTQYMADLVKKGHAVPVSADSHTEEGKKWYLPHHSVQHPAKPEKTRLVFDTSAKYFGTSFDDQLLQGPNLANTLSVLIRFRKEKVAFMADIREMFYQVQVPERDMIFFMVAWWRYINGFRRICNEKHIFGFVSSPRCANFALKQCAKDKFNVSPEAAKTIEHSFYIDDCLKSVESITKAVKLVGEVKQMCAKGDFNLTKVVSNQPEVTANLPSFLKTESMQYTELGGNAMLERALGVIWDFRQDTYVSV